MNNTADVKQETWLDYVGRFLFLIFILSFFGFYLRDEKLSWGRHIEYFLTLVIFLVSITLLIRAISIIFKVPYGVAGEFIYGSSEKPFWKMMIRVLRNGILNGISISAIFYFKPYWKPFIDKNSWVVLALTALILIPIAYMIIRSIIKFFTPDAEDNLPPTTPD